MINITTGLNPNYPNPPAWGISLYINGKESPVLVLVRGVEYTFNIMASEEHPVYITGKPFFLSFSLPLISQRDVTAVESFFPSITDRFMQFRSVCFLATFSGESNYVASAVQLRGLCKSSSGEAPSAGAEEVLSCLRVFPEDVWSLQDCRACT